MLVLSRNPSQAIILNNVVKITVLQVVGRKVRIGVEAPDHVRVLREELVLHGGGEEGGEPCLS